MLPHPGVALRTSLENPHPESEETEALGMADWVGAPGDEDLLDPQAGVPVCWVPGIGWVLGETPTTA